MKLPKRELAKLKRARADIKAGRTKSMGEVFEIPQAWIDLQLKVAARLKKAGITPKDLNEVIYNLRRATKPKKKKGSLPWKSSS